jgi:peroxiredoxin
MAETSMVDRSRKEILEDTIRQCCEMDASLNERLAYFSAVSQALDPSYSELIDQLVDRLKRYHGGAIGPQPGESMPSFLLTDQSGHLVSLDDVLSEGPVALIFHRGHWCAYCRINTKTLADAHPRFKRCGGQIVAIMPERQNFTAQLHEDLSLPFPILTDIDNGYALSLNLAIWLGTEMRDFFAGRGYDLSNYQGNDSWMVPIPAAFVVGTNRLVKARFTDPDYRRSADVDDLLRALQGSD